jgi:hypothetical protein
MRGEIQVLSEKAGGRWIAKSVLIDGFVPEKALIEVACLSVGGGIEFGLYGLTAYFIPAKCTVSLSESTVATHQPAIGILAAGVFSQNLLRVSYAAVTIIVIY